MKIKNYKLKITLLVLSTLFCILSTTQVKAASSFDLSVSPSIFQADLTPPSNAQVKEQLVLENKGDEPLDLAIVFRHFRPADESGQVEYLKEDETPGADPLIFQRVAVEENGQRLQRVLIPPKTTKKYNLHINVPKDEPPSDYYFSILFINDAQLKTENGEPITVSEQSSGSNAVGGIGINVLLSIGPKGETAGSIEQFSTPFFQGSGPVPFNVRVRNDSAHFIYPEGNIEIKNMFGQRIGLVELLPLNILSGMTRALPSREQFVFEAQKQSGQLDEKTLEKLASKQDGLLAIWPEKFLLGPYTATLTLALSDQGPIYRRSVIFIGFPLLIVTGFFIAIAIVLLIRSRLRARRAG